MELAKLRKPQYVEVEYEGGGKQLFLYVPVGAVGDLGPLYVIAFAITEKGPEKQWKGKVIYRAPNLGSISPANRRHAWNQAYAVCKHPAKVLAEGTVTS